MPFCAARITRGAASCKADVAVAASPEASASSNLRTWVRIWLRRERLTAVRRSILRTAFLADLVFAMDFPQSGRARCGEWRDVMKRADRIGACASAARRQRRRAYRGTGIAGQLLQGQAGTPARISSIA